jgi:hypothetical protein
MRREIMKSHKTWTPKKKTLKKSIRKSLKRLSRPRSLNRSSWQFRIIWITT